MSGARGPGGDVLPSSVMPAPSALPRFCPLCDVRTADATCATHNVPTVLADSAEEDSVPSEGAMIGARYRVDQLLGRGGMGDVVLATQLGIDRRVAIKTLNARTTTSADGIKRFYREARAMVKMEHPNVVKVFDFGIDDRTGAPYLVMEYLRGRTLGEVLEIEGRLPEARACRLLAQVAKALVEANAKGIVHRDLKPENIHVRQLADGDEFVKVLDFGIAKVHGAGVKPGAELTRVGAMIGTPAYMSPEQIRGKKVDTRSDLYALGCILHECLTGHPPFEESDAASLFVAHLTNRPSSLPSRLVDGRPPTHVLAALRDRLLEKAPADRPATPSEVARVLGAIGHGEAEAVVVAAPSPPPTPARAVSKRERPGVASQTRPGPVAKSKKLSGASSRSEKRTRMHDSPGLVSARLETVALPAHMPVPVAEPPVDEGQPERRRGLWLGAVVAAGVLLAIVLLVMAPWKVDTQTEKPASDTVDSAPEEVDLSVRRPSAVAPDARPRRLPADAPRVVVAPPPPMAAKAVQVTPVPAPPVVTKVTPPPPVKTEQPKPKAKPAPRIARKPRPKAKARPRVKVKSKGKKPNIGVW